MKLEEALEEYMGRIRRSTDIDDTEAQYIETVLSLFYTMGERNMLNEMMEPKLLVKQSE